MATSEVVTAEFRRAFWACPESDMRTALEYARKAAALLIPPGVVGHFDDDALIFEAEGEELDKATLREFGLYFGDQS
jgi:hypothetical protein